MAEYINKHKAYMMLKDLEAAYLQYDVKEAYAKAALRIDQMPKADVQPVKRGKWDFQGYQLFRCTNCKKIYTQEQLEDIGEEWAFPNFCPNCGADMQEESKKNG